MTQAPLTWEEGGAVLAPGDLRARAVDLATCLEGLGAAELWQGRRESYRDAIAYGEPDAVRSWFAPSSVPEKIRGRWLLSSCGLTRRRIEAALGVDSAGLYPVYVDGSAMVACQAAAHASDAWRPVSELDALGPGDAVWRADRQHVATVIERDGARVITVDGGQAGGLGEGTEIARRVRWLVGRTLSDHEGIAGWPILAFTAVDRLRVTRDCQIAWRLPPASV